MSKFTEKQEQAIKASGNTLVSAGAGSGKTTVLSHRLIHLLHNGVSLDRVLVLTFTENAALNMKKRIKNLLRGETDLKSQIKLVDGSDIMTFDAFNQKIVRKYRSYIGIDEDFKVVNEAVFSVLKRKYLRKRFDDLYLSKDKDLAWILLRFTKKRDDPIFDFILKVEEKLASISDPTAYLSKMMGGLSDDKIAEIYNSLFLDYQKKFNFYLSEIDSMHLDNEFMTKLMKKMSPLTHCQNFDDFKFQIECVGRLPAMRGLDEESKERYDRITSIFKNISKSVLSIPGTNTFKTVYQSQRKYLEFIYREVVRLKKLIAEYKRRNNAYSFQDIATMVIALLKKNDEVREELKEHYQVVMVDEYQDNSDIQEEVISMLSNDNLFLVGDVKQSIYRFRHANPKLFMKRYEEYLNGRNSKLIDMNDNFRSTPSVINDVNYIFSNLMSLEFGGADYSNHHIIRAANSKYQSFNDMNRLIAFNSDELNSEEIAKREIELVALDIKKRVKASNSSYSDYAIILDRYQYFPKLIKIFSDHGIPVAASFNSNLVSFDLSMILLNIFKLLYFLRAKNFDVKFKHAFYSVARSYLYEMEDAQVYEVITKEDYKSTSLFQDLQTILLKVEGQSLSTIVDEVVRVMDLPSKLVKTADYKSDLKILEAFYQNVQELAKLGYDLQMMIDHFKAIDSFGLTYSTKIQNQSDNAVTLISIHSSKGLEYNHCYFLCLNKVYNERELNEALKFDEHLGIIFPIGSKDFDCEGESAKVLKSPLEVFYKMKEKNEDRSEHLRLLYVALTRAMLTMTFVYPSIKKSKLEIADCNSFLSLLDFISYRKRLEEVVIEDNDDNTMTNSAVASGDYNFIYHELSLSKTEEVMGEARASKSVTHVSRSLLKRGERIHRALEVIDLKNPDLSLIRDERDQELIRGFLQQDIFKGIQEADIYQEYEFVDELHQTHGIIDLLLLFKDRAVIIDYKLRNTADPAYLKQLDVYKDYIATLIDLPIELYLYSLVERRMTRVN